MFAGKTGLQPVDSCGPECGDLPDCLADDRPGTGVLRIAIQGMSLHQYDSHENNISGSHEPYTMRILAAAEYSLAG